MNQAITPPAHLPPKQQLFYVYYLQTLNAVQSAIKAGYSKNTALKSAYLWVGKNLEKCPKAYQPLCQAINESKAHMIEKVALTPARVLEEWMSIAFFNLQDIFDQETGNPLPINELPPEAVSALESLQVLKESSKIEGQAEVNTAMVKFKAHQKTKALEFLSKYLRIDPTHDYKKGGYNQAGSSETEVIGKVLRRIGGRTRGLPAPVREIPENFNLEGE